MAALWAAARGARATGARALAAPRRGASRAAGAAAGGPRGAGRGASAAGGSARAASAMAHGRLVTAAPGPTAVPERVLAAMHAETTDYVAVLRSGEQVCEDLRALARTKHHIKVCPGNGHVGWQMALANVLDRGDVAVVLDSRGFGHLWGLVAKSLGAELRPLAPSAMHQRIDPNALEQCLREDSTHRVRAVLAMHTESDTTVHYDIPALRAAIDAAGHPALLLVDCVSTLGCARFEMDLWGVDVFVAASQKGLMLPPGLCILGIGERALEARRRLAAVPMCSDWLCGMTADPMGHWTPPRVGGGGVPWTSPGTPPTHLLLGLAAALDIILREQGLEQTWERHEAFARAVWAAVDAWGAGAPIRCFVPEAEHRSPVATLIKMEDVDVMRLRQWCRQEANLLLPGAGLGFLLPPGEENFQEGFSGHDAFRIGHMGHANPPMLLGTLATVDCALKALRVPHGGGAVEAAAQVLADRWSQRGGA